MTEQVIDNSTIELSEHYFGIEWIDTETLIIDPSYQRPLKASLIRTIREAWDWRAVRTLAVSLRKGETGQNYYAVIDGQQRLTAAREKDIEKLPCQVYIDLTPQQEAELFLKLNNSLKPSANDLFRAKIAEGDPQAKLIMGALSYTGWTFDYQADSHSNNKLGGSRMFCATVIGSATALTQIYQRGGIMHLQSVLKVAHGWFGQHLAGSADMLQGLSYFLNKYHNTTDMSRLTEKLANETPSGLLGKAVQLQAAERSANLGYGSNSRPRALSRVLVGMYNKGLRPANKLEDN